MRLSRGVRDTLTMPSEQKAARLSALAGDNGVIAALAIDQRSSLRKMMAEAAGAGSEPITAQQLSEFKEIVTRHLTPFASAILIDPEFGLAAIAVRTSTCGLLL